MCLDSDHGHKKRRDSLEAHVVLLMFLLELENSSGGGSTGNTSKQRKGLLAVRIFFVEMTLMLLYPFFHSYPYGANISEVGKDHCIKKDYHKCSLRVIACTKHTNNSRKYCLLGHQCN